MEQIPEVLCQCALDDELVNVKIKSWLFLYVQYILQKWQMVELSWGCVFLLAMGNEAVEALLGGPLL